MTNATYGCGLHTLDTLYNERMNSPGRHIQVHSPAGEVISIPFVFGVPQQVVQLPVPPGQVIPRQPDVTLALSARVIDGHQAAQSPGSAPREVIKES